MKYFSSLKLKLIYVFRINDAAHEGCLKIGEATCDDENVIGLAPNSKPLNEAARKRIKPIYTDRRHTLRPVAYRTDTVQPWRLALVQ